jgi:DNA processing protein
MDHQQPQETVVQHGSHRLFCTGDVSLLQHPRLVAIVGSRKASEAGNRRAQRLARELVAAGCVVVSGLAAGVDTSAHRSALVAKGRTVAVIGTSSSEFYPRENEELQRLIAARHLVVSLLESGKQGHSGDFVRRNAVIAAISHAVVLVEAQDRSGSQYAPVTALDLGKPVFFCASAGDDPRLKWPVTLKNSGAIPLRETAQVLWALDAVG